MLIRHERVLNNCCVNALKVSSLKSQVNFHQAFHAKYWDWTATSAGLYTKLNTGPSRTFEMTSPGFCNNDQAPLWKVEVQATDKHSKIVLLYTVTKCLRSDWQVSPIVKDWTKCGQTCMLFPLVSSSLVFPHMSVYSNLSWVVCPSSTGGIPPHLSQCEHVSATPPTKQNNLNKPMTGYNIQSLY